jgi:hypothetical protein
MTWHRKPNRIPRIDRKQELLRSPAAHYEKMRPVRQVRDAGGMTRGVGLWYMQVRKRKLSVKKFLVDARSRSEVYTGQCPLLGLGRPKQANPTAPEGS